jgi:hypothetical protein
MATNAGKDQMDFRIRRLSVLTPSALASTTIQVAIVDHGINLNAKACGENGDGAFTWLFHVDKTAGQVKTGGSPPTTDPFGAGYCFADLIAPGGTTHVAPVSGKITFDSTGTKFSSEVIDHLIVPIFVANDVNQLIMLPLSGVGLKDVTISNNGDCIGSFNFSALDDQCADSRSDCSRWHTGGALAGYITLEEADTVAIPQLGGNSLCIMLTGGTPTADKKCARDASNQIKAKGDFCSTTKMPGGCQDSYWLAATFAASAVKIKPSSSDPLCSGAVSPSDGGTDSGSPDAGHD